MTALPRFGRHIEVASCAHWYRGGIEVLTQQTLGAKCAHLGT